MNQPGLLNVAARVSREEDIQVEGTSVFKVLALDGGGYRGLYTAIVLREIEQHNGSLAEHFDLLCGTSVGALIALGLAAGRSAEEAVTFFETCGPEIFPRGPWFARLARGLRQIGIGAKYRSKALEKALHSWLGNHTMAESNSYVCIPALNFTTWSPTVLKTDHDPSLTRDSDLLMREVARATSAAPFYFPAAAITGHPGLFLDGGLWANNPSLIGLIEACRFFAGPGKAYGSVRILSVGTVDQTPGRSVRESGDLALRSGLAVLRSTLCVQERATAFAVLHLGSSLAVPAECIRIPSPEPSAEQARDIALDAATPQATATLKTLAHERAHAWNKRPEVVSFFAAPAAAPRFRKHSRLSS